MAHEVSVIIPSYNSADSIEGCVGSVERQSASGNVLEIVVVDCSDDGTTRGKLLDMARDGRIKTVFSPIRTMPAVNRNIGACKARAGILVFIDSDIYMEETWLEKMLEAYDAGCMIAGGGVDIPGSQRNKPVPLAQLYFQMSDHLNTGNARTRDFVPGCNILCEREIFVRTGGFPEVDASEDVIFGMKAGRITDLWFIPAAKVYHIFREDIMGVLGHQSLLGRYTGMFRRITPGRVYFGKVLAVLFLPLLLLSKFMLVSLRVIRTGPGNTLRFAAVFPIIILCLLSWGYGFTAGCINGEQRMGSCPIR